MRNFVCRLVEFCVLVDGLESDWDQASEGGEQYIVVECEMGIDHPIVLAIVPENILRFENS